MNYNLYVGGNFVSHVRQMILDLNFYCCAPSVVDCAPTLNLQIYQAAVVSACTKLRLVGLFIHNSINNYQLYIHLLVVPLVPPTVFVISRRAKTSCGAVASSRSGRVNVEFRRSIRRCLVDGTGQSLPWAFVPIHHHLALIVTLSTFHLATPML